MQTTINTTIRKILYGIMLAGMVFAVLGMSSAPAVRAQEDGIETPIETSMPTVMPTEATSLPTVENLKQACYSISEEFQVVIIDAKASGNWGIVWFVANGGSEPGIAIGNWENDHWEIALGNSDHFLVGNSDHFLEWVRLLPDSLLSEGEKAFILPSTDIQALSTPLTGYKLPYPGGTTYPVTQGNNSSPSHNTPAEAYAFDFGLHESSEPIMAARSGRIFDLRESEGTGCQTISCWNTANFIVIVHEPDDGYADLYMHLAQNSVIPNAGDWVVQGQPIAVAGNSGWTCNNNCSGPGSHLHFQVENKPSRRSLNISDTSWWTNSSYPITFSDISLLPINGVPLGGCSYESSGITLYENFYDDNDRTAGGRRQTFTGYIPDLRSTYLGTDAASSVRVAQNWSVMLWKGYNKGQPYFNAEKSRRYFTDEYWSDGSGLDNSVRSLLAGYAVCISPQGLEQENILENSEVTNQTGGDSCSPPSDTTPPSGSWTSPSNSQTISSRTVTLSVNASDNAGGSGVREVRWSGKWNNTWYGVGTDNTSPYSISWDMCNSGVPNGDIELGFEVWDNANNKWVYSEHSSNIHINKSYTCTQSNNDTTPPSGYWTSPGNGQTISSQSVTISVNASDNSGGSGVQDVRWSAKWNNQWYGIGTDNSSPYSISWDMCSSGVPNGDVELGFEVWDNANNKWVYSEHSTNYHVTKNYTCTSSGSWETWGWQNKYLAGYDNWHGTVTWDNYPYIWWDFGSGGPFGWGGDEFSLRMQRDVYFQGGYYSFHADHDDGAKVWVDGNLIINAWWDGNGGHDAGTNLSQGYHQVKVEYYENTGDAKIHVLWYGPGYPRPDNNPPDGHITSPDNHSATAYYPLTITADASDDASGVNRVEFYVWYCAGTCNWRLIGTDYDSPYSVTWDWSSLSDQHVYLTTHMIDNTGKVSIDPGGYVEVDLDRTSPSVSITSPTDGDVLSGDQFTIYADASDSLSGIGALQFIVGYSETGTASIESIPEPPVPARGDSGMLVAQDVTSQDYWHEIGWDTDGSDGWSFGWTPTDVPDQAGISLFIYAYDRAGNYQGTMRSSLILSRPPANDNFDTPTQINSNTYTNQQFTSGATSAMDDPALTDCNRAPGLATVWYQYVPPTDGQLQLDTIGSDYDTMLAVWTGARGSLILKACNDDRSSDLQSELRVYVTSGTIYYIEVAQYGGFLATSLDAQVQTKPEPTTGNVTALSGGMLQLNMYFGQPDLAISDILIYPNALFTNDNVYMYFQVQNIPAFDASSFWLDVYIDREPTDCSAWGDYWVRTSGLAANSTDGWWFIEIPAGALSAGSHQVSAFVDSGCEVSESNEMNNVTGPIAFTVTDAPPAPAHDDFDAATLVPAIPYSDTVDVSGATLASDDPVVPNCSLAAGLASVWYKYTPSANTRLALDTTGSSYDTYLAVWSGSRGSLSAVACNDDSGGTPQSALQVNLTAATTYYIEIAQYNGWYSSASAASDTEPALRTLPRPGDTEIPSGAPPQPEANAGVSAASTKTTPDVSTLAGGTLSFHASVVTYTITGNAGESGVTLRYTDGTAKSVTSASNGRYTITVPYNWSGSVTPSKTGLTFSPTSKSYSHLTANQASQNYYAVMTIPSTGSYDGYILESTETSGTGGSLDATATTFILGDASADRQYRALLAFNTASLPDTATIQSVVVKIKQYGSPVGSNPFSILGSLYTDIRKGYFGTGLSLQTSDFNAAASTTSVAATFGKTPVSAWYSATLTSTARTYVNKTSWTELRLRFSKDDDDDGGADYMRFYSGNYSTSSYRPQLIITYTLP